ncbi:MAG: GldG family protein, partial [Muribaculaceae bacterium]|nr:GldG family protein [Muribaculaceae bacterium]
NLGLNYVPDQYTAIDVTANKLYTLTEDSRQLIDSLEQDVTVYVLADEASKDSDLDKTLRQFQGLSDHVEVEYINPVANPKFYYKYTDTEPTANSLIVVGPQDYVVVDYGDIYTYELNYSTYQNELTGYDGEGQIVSAIARVTAEELPKFYSVAGHGELSFDERFVGALSKENVAHETLTLHAVDEIPEDADGIILNAPTSDYSSEDADKVIAYLEKGGEVLLIPTWTEASMINFERIIDYYGVSLVEGMIVEKDRSRYYQIPYYLFPQAEEDAITQKVLDGTVFAPFARGLSYDEDAADVSYKPLLRTSESSFSKTELSANEDYDKREGDIDGPFVIALKAEKETEGGKVSRAVILATEQMFTASADDVVPGYNVQLFSSIISCLADRESSVTVPVKYYEIGNLAFSARVLGVSAAAACLVPIVCLAAGFAVWLRRRKR